MPVAMTTPSWRLPPVYRSMEGGVYVIPTRNPAEIIKREYESVDTPTFQANLILKILRDIKQRSVSSAIQSWVRYFLEWISVGAVSEKMGCDGAWDSLSLEDQAWVRDGRLWRGMTLWHISVLLPHRPEVWAWLAQSEIPDQPDDWGATAGMRAQQVGVTGIEDFLTVPMPVFDPWVWQARHGQQHEIQCPDDARKIYPLCATSGPQCDLDLLLYLYLFMPDDFDPARYNQEESDQFHVRSGLPLKLQATQSVMVADMDHTPLVEQWGLFATGPIQKGGSIFCINAALRFADVDDLGLCAPEGIETVYRYLGFDIMRSVVETPSQLWVSGIHLDPVVSASPTMMLNDAGVPGGANIQFAYQFESGLPVVYLVATHDIAAGFELLGSYFSGLYGRVPLKSWQNQAHPLF